MSRLAGRRALVTGAGGMLGRASSLRFAREGAAVAGLACFLASDDAAWLTGQVVTLDGGITCHYL